MKLLLKLILILTLCFSNYSLSQTNMLEVSPSRIKSKFNIPPLEVIIDSVLKNNAQLSYRKSSVKIKETNIKSKRIDLTRHFGISADTRYGNFNNFNTNEDGQLTTAFATTSKQFNYSAGFYLKIPIFDFLNRKKMLRVAKLELEEAQGLAEAQEETMRQIVIKLYQDLLLKEKLLEIKAKTLGDGKVNMQMVEKEFRNGLVPVAEYVRITNITSSLEIEFEKGKSEFLLAKCLLEDLAGFKFERVTRN